MLCVCIFGIVFSLNKLHLPILYEKVQTPPIPVDHYAMEAWCDIWNQRLKSGIMYDTVMSILWDSKRFSGLLGSNVLPFVNIGISAEKKNW